MSSKLWIRAETKAGEARTAITPATAASLLSYGFELTVEQSEQRAIADSDFSELGCQLAPPGSWRSAPQNTYIVGLKELPEDGAALQHRHIYFAHAYKKQQGWQQLMRRFQVGGGELLDLEYLTDADGRRIAAFGYWAGFTGAALAVMTWCGQQLNLSPPIPALTSWPSKDKLIADCQALLDRALQQAERQPRLLLIGALGRVGSGALALAEALNLAVTPWDLQETAVGGPFSEIIEHDIFVNAVMVQQALPPFIDQSMLERPGRQLQVIADVSCDPFGDYNPIPLYSRCTSLAEPTLRLKHPPATLDLIAIDNLPALLPVESSDDFAKQLLPALLSLNEPQQAIWQRAQQLFLDTCEQLEKH